MLTQKEILAAEVDALAHRAHEIEPHAAIVLAALAGALHNHPVVLTSLSLCVFNFEQERREMPLEGLEN